jgi:DNA-binding ferritin-like protein
VTPTAIPRVGKHTTNKQMAKTNQIHATLTAEQMTTIHSAIETLREQLPFLVDLSSEEIRRLAKAGDFSKGFLQKALLIAEQTPEILPRNFAIEEFRADMALAENLEEIALALKPLLERINNTVIVARSDAYGHALITYDRSKKSVDQGLTGVTRDLGQRFARKASTKKQESAAPTPAPQVLT